MRIISIAALLIAAGILTAAVAFNGAMMLIYYFCTGFGFGAITATFPTAIANYFGAGAFSKSLGVGIFVTTIIASVLPLAGGVIYDACGSCSPAFFLACGGCRLLCGVWFLRQVPQEVSYLVCQSVIGLSNHDFLKPVHTIKLELGGWRGGGL